MKNIIIFFINVYRLFISKALAPLLGNCCRYEISCSQYSKIVISKYGAINGSLLSLKRIVSCRF